MFKTIIKFKNSKYTKIISYQHFKKRIETIILNLTVKLWNLEVFSPVQNILLTHECKKKTKIKNYISKKDRRKKSFVRISLVYLFKVTCEE